MQRVESATRQQVEQAIAVMLDHFRDNDWLINEYWPQNEPHVRLMLADMMLRFPPDPKIRLLDVGCFNGYMSLVFGGIGYTVVGTDASESTQRDSVFKNSGVDFVSSNFNDLEPFGHLQPESFDIIVIAQVIEHILNYPLGLVRSLASLMRPGGLMILTTPNPATVMNATRLLRGRSLLWGASDFIEEPKIAENRIITKADIHYHEYTGEELFHLLEAAGLCIEHSRYLSVGSSGRQSAFKRFLKGNPVTRKLFSTRLMGSQHYFLARKV